MKLSKGDIACFVNSDDQFYSDKTLYYAHRAFKQNEIDFIFGPVKNIGVYFMDINHIRFIGAGVFTLVIQLAFL